MVDAAIARVGRVLGPHSVRMVLQIAAKDMTLAMDDMERSARLNDLIMFQRSRHAMSGILLTFGFAEMAENCAALIQEESGRVPDVSDFRQSILNIVSRLSDA